MKEGAGFCDATGGIGGITTGGGVAFFSGATVSTLKTGTASLSFSEKEEDESFPPEIPLSPLIERMKADFKEEVSETLLLPLKDLTDMDRSEEEADVSCLAGCLRRNIFAVVANIFLFLTILLILTPS